MSARAAFLLMMLCPAWAMASPLGVLTMPAVGQVLAQQRDAGAPKAEQLQPRAAAQADKAEQPRNADNERPSAAVANSAHGSTEPLSDGEKFASAEPQDGKRDRAQ
jgi:hypothetical protein